MLRFLGGLVCRVLGHRPAHRAERDDTRRIWVNRCVRCGDPLYVTLPCPEYPDEGMHNCGDVMCSRIPGFGGDVCEDALRCRIEWDEAQARGRSVPPSGPERRQIREGRE